MADITDRDLDALFDVPFVFWTCPKGCRGYVDWNEGSTVATCQECGTTSAPRVGAPSANPLIAVPDIVELKDSPVGEELDRTFGGKME